jgi:phytanoyl-CoA hydroxylase
MRFIDRIFRRSEHRALTSKQMEFWGENGFLILPGFYSARDFEEYEKEFQECWSRRGSKEFDITIDILEGALAGRRMRWFDAPDDALTLSHKLNDLYLDLEGYRKICLSQKLTSILAQLLGGIPVVINSLSFQKGSEQAHHFDTYYMPPPAKDRMVVSSVCLEGQNKSAGPLSYFPGSHKIDPWVFPHGTIAANGADLSDATRYANAEVERLGLTESTFVGELGDVFIWHSQLYHGGLPIIDRSQTRKTLVTHYWREDDMDSSNLIRVNNGGYLNRSHQPV